MTETKWTPGPWFHSRAKTPVDGEYDWCVGAEIDGRKHVLIEAFGRVAEDVRPTAEANARLISAAPDLYEALENVMREFGPGTMSDAAFNGACAALAKARGETSNV